jgi:hypothetical protein
VTTHLGPEPSYCTRLMGEPLTPSQWTTCWKYGWNEPTTTVARIGQYFGHHVSPVLIVVAVIFVAVIVITRPSGR